MIENAGKKKVEKEVGKKKGKKKLVVNVTNNVKKIGWRSFANFFFIA